jgi:hypothetical protein
VSRRGAAFAASLLLATWLAAPAIAAETPVSGRFRAGERVIQPEHACAYPVRDLRHARQQVIEVVLSQRPVDVDAAVAALDPHQVVINQKIGDYVLLWVRADGSVSMNATFSATMSQYLDSTDKGLFGGSLLAELTENAAGHVGGRVHSASPVKTRSDETYEIDVTFRTTIRQTPRGDALARDGGEPGKALGELKAAADRKDWQRMRSRFSREALASIEADYRSARENRDAALDRLDAWLPRKRMKITGGDLRGDTADLDVEGESRGGLRTLYRVRMTREPEGWHFDQATMAGLLE